MKDTIELAINEETIINGIHIKCVEDTVDGIYSCTKCIFSKLLNCSNYNIVCSKSKRLDKTDVHFVRIK